MSYIINEGSPQDRNSLSLHTSKRNHIRNVRRNEAPPERRKAIVDLYKSTYPRAIVRSISQCYNCMGLVFASRRTCIDIDELQPIFNDDGFTKVDNLNESMIGDVVVYSRDHQRRHVGIIVQKEELLGTLTIRVLSQWGWDAEVIHPYDYVHPDHGVFSEIWTDRKMPSCQ